MHCHFVHGQRLRALTGQLLDRLAQALGQSPVGDVFTRTRSEELLIG